MSDNSKVMTEIRTLLGRKDWTGVRMLLRDAPPPDVADVLLALGKQERVLLFRLLPRSLASDAFSYLEPFKKDELLKDLSDEEARELLADLYPDDLAEFLEEMPGMATQRLLNLLDPDDRKDALNLLGYPEKSVGRLMTPYYVAVRPEWTVAQALDHIRERGRDSETIHVIHVVDARWRLLDTLSLRRFILAGPDDTVERIMDRSFVSITASEDRQEAVRLIQHYDLVTLPVVDSGGVLLGIVTVDDVLDVAQKEATEDIQLSAAVSPLKISYRDSGLWTLFSRRVGWLAALVLVNMASGGVIAYHEDLLTSSIALTFFIPLLIATGGNAGSQSATLMVRAMATGEVKPAQYTWAVGRELVVGLILGLALGLLSWMLGFYRGGVQMALVLFLAMASIVVVTNIIGAGLPFILYRLGMDPAVASSPLVTSVADVVGLIIYFFIASNLMGIPG
ncbi:magnesium transporter [Syntrophus buswellii]|uniref:magnesium transporter n=1 Tax=Syntrophus buswellii TaxID=43774 RepID=UPI0038D4F187